MKIFISLLFSVCSLSMLAQNPYQDLMESIESKDSWAEQSVLYDSLVRQARKNGLKDYRQYINLTISAAKASNEYDFAGNYVFELSRSYRNLDTALSILNEPLNWGENLTEANKGVIQRGKGLAYYRANQKDSALHYWTLASKTFELLGDSSQSEFAWSYIAAAGVLRSFGEFVQASNLLEKARLLFEYQKDSIGLILTMNDVATLYGINGFHEKAAEQREKVLKIADPVKNHRLVVLTYLNYSLEARELGKDSLELALLQKSLTLLDSTSLNSMEYQFLGLYELVNAYSRRDSFREANFYFDQMKILEPRFRDKKWLVEIFLKGKVNILYGQGKYSEAIALAKEIREGALIRNDIETMMTMERLLHRIYKANSDYENALMHYENYTAVKDSLSSVEKTNALLYLETQYQDERKNRLITKQEGDIKLLATTNQFQTKLVWAIAIGLLFLFGAVYLFRSRKYVVQAKQMQEEFSQQLLSSHEDERKRISRDLHDSVGQSLMLIKNKIVLDQDEETVTMVSQALEEVRTISKALHPILLEKLGLTASIEKLISDFDDHTDILFFQEVDQIDGIFTKDQELQIFRIIQESVNNMIKHAKTPSASVIVTNEPKKVTVLIEDSGVGFDMTAEEYSVKSLGMKTLKERTQILRGKMVIDSVKGKGTSILLEVPKQS